MIQINKAFQTFFKTSLWAHANQCWHVDNKSEEKLDQWLNIVNNSTIISNLM